MSNAQRMSSVYDVGPNPIVEEGKLMRVGAVSYLNTKPLVYGLAHQSQSLQLSFDLPSRLATSLQEGSLDVALIPSIAATHSNDYRVISDACIGCQGPVWSVKLVSRVPFDQIGSLALDEGSRTSATLVQILLWQRFGIRPQLAEFPIGAELADLAADAVLIIGDRAMFSERLDEYPFQWDLGEEWLSETGLPFVFAVWTARNSHGNEEIESVLSTARDQGLEYLHEIAEVEAPRYGLSIDRCHEYLADNLHFVLGPKEKAGLALFISQAAELGLIPRTCELKFDDCQTT